VHDRAFLFDVDGTLTPSRHIMDSGFQKRFMEFQRKHSTYLVTGSDYEKTLEQVGSDCIGLTQKTFQCSGNEIRKNGEVIHLNKWTPNTEVIRYLNNVLDSSLFPTEHRSSRFIEYRTGSINFSIVGRTATLEQRQKYIEFDRTNGERLTVLQNMHRAFPDLSISIGGETGLDIMCFGYDKSQIIRHIPERVIYFYGDAIYPNGNDYSLAVLLSLNENNKVFPVTDWRDTDVLLGVID